MERNTVRRRVNGKPKQMQAMSEVLGRLQLAYSLGLDTYSGDRDVYQALGYPKTITKQNYWSRYLRQDIARAIIDRPVKASWKGKIDVIETVKEKSTKFEVKWKELFDGLNLKSVFIRADKLTGLGRFSILLLGLDDVAQTEQFKTPVSRKGLKLLYVKPISEVNCSVAKFEESPNDPRFGLPLLYDVNTTVGSRSQTIQIHHSRVVHLVEDLGENEVYGTPRLQAVYNRLIDLEKLVGGDAEMFWRGARPGYTGTVDPEYQMSDTAREDLQEQIDEFENNLRRILVNQGVTYNALEQQIADPLPHIDGQIQLVSSVTGIPKRILIGSERGELSSAQDKQEWITYVTSRREEQNEPMIIRPFIDQCIEIGVLPVPASPYRVIWDKVFSLSDKEKVEMGKMRAEALKDYTMNGLALEVIPVGHFAEHFLALDDTQVEELMEKVDEEKVIEDALTPEEGEVMEKEEEKKKE